MNDLNLKKTVRLENWNLEQDTILNISAEIIITACVDLFCATIYCDASNKSNL